MDSDETEDERNRKNIVPHPQTVRRRNRTLYLALDTGNVNIVFLYTY